MSTLPDKGVSKKQKIDLLMAENKRLEDLLLAKSVPTDEPDPDLQLTPETAPIFDELMVNTLIETEGRTIRAFNRLGYAITLRDRKERDATIRRVLSRPGVAQRLDAYWGEISRHRNPIIARMARMARYSPNEDAAMQAATFLAKIGGWFAAEKRETLVGNVSAFQSMRAAMESLNHEPGAAIAISDDEKPAARVKR